MGCPKYPNVRCDAHPGQDRPGYVVCVHVLAGAEVGHQKLASEKDLGLIVCARCFSAADAARGATAAAQTAQRIIDQTRLICEDCAKENKLLLGTA